jgi:hypothetical protein
MMEQIFCQATSNGFITQEVFENYIVNFIIPHMRKRFPTGMILILLDGCSAHSFTIELAEKLSMEDISFIYFPPHMTAKLQPLDRGNYFI